MMRNPERRHTSRKMRNLVEVSYWRNRLSIEFNDTRCSIEDIQRFSESLIGNYLKFRHPYIEIEIVSGRVFDLSNTLILAEME